MRGAVRWARKVAGVPAIELIHWLAIGNMIDPVFAVLRRQLLDFKVCSLGGRFPAAASTEEKLLGKDGQVTSMNSWVCSFVAIPLPGTGAWSVH